MNELSTNRKEQALLTHNRILANGQIAAQALIAVCEDLKRMRDEKLYEELEYDSFEDYAEQACGIKQRQAYSYIAAYERLGTNYLRQHSELGITKLELLSQIPDYEREDFTAAVDVEDISTRELKEEVQKWKNQFEQLSLDIATARTELETKADELTAADEQLKEAQEEIEQLKAKPTAVAVEVDQEAVDKAVAEAKAQSNDEIQKLKQQLKDAKSKAKQEKESAMQKANERIDKLVADADKKDEQLQQAIKAAKVAGADEDTIAVRLLFIHLQSTANELKKHLASIDAKDPEKAHKLAITISRTMTALFCGVE